MCGVSDRVCNVRGNAPYIASLESHLRRADVITPEHLEVSIRYADSEGVTSVQGGKDLKGTQAYPPLFGVQVALSHQEWIQQGAPTVDPPTPPDSDSDTCSDISLSCLNDLVEDCH